MEFNASRVSPLFPDAKTVNYIIKGNVYGRKDNFKPKLEVPFASACSVVVNCENYILRVLK